MRYAVARYNESQRVKAYRIFVTDCLRSIIQAHGGEAMRYAEIAYPAQQNKGEQVTPENAKDTATGLFDRIGIEVVE